MSRPAACHYCLLPIAYCLITPVLFSDRLPPIAFKVIVEVLFALLFPVTVVVAPFHTVVMVAAILAAMHAAHVVPWPRPAFHMPVWSAMVHAAKKQPPEDRKANGLPIGDYPKVEDDGHEPVPKGQDHQSEQQGQGCKTDDAEEYPPGPVPAVPEKAFVLISVF